MFPFTRAYETACVAISDLPQLAPQWIRFLANQQTPELKGEIRSGTWDTNIGLQVSCRRLGAPGTEDRTYVRMAAGADLNKPSAKKTIYSNFCLAPCYLKSKNNEKPHIFGGYIVCVNLGDIVFEKQTQPLTSSAQKCTSINWPIACLKTSKASLTHFRRTSQNPVWNINFVIAWVSKVHTKFTYCLS